MSSAPDASLVERVRLQGAAFLKKPFFPADIEAVLRGITDWLRSIRNAPETE